jgi:hypothetical protein
VIYSSKRLLIIVSLFPLAFVLFGLAVDPPALMFRGLLGCLPRSNDAQGPGLQGGARAESLPRQRLYESGLPLAGAKAGARAGVPSDA